MIVLQILQSEDELKKLVNTKELEFFNCFFARYSFLQDLSQLQLLSIVKPESKDLVDCSHLSGYSQLQFLDLQSCNIQHFEGIQSCTQLVQLSLLGTNLPDDYLDSLSKLTNLKDLFMNHQYTDIDLPGVNVRSSYSEFLFDNDEEKDDFVKKLFKTHMLENNMCFFLIFLCYNEL